MTDLHTRFRTLDSLSTPDLWNDIEERAMAMQPTRRSSAWVLIAVTLLLALAIGGAVLVGSGIVKLPVSVDASASPSSANPSSSAQASTAASSSPVAPVPASWTATGSMNAAHQSNTATVLADGRVLVVGGYGAGGAVLSAELYDPTTRSWTATGDPAEGRYGHTATLLNNGTVLVAGGYTGGSVSPYAPTASVELFDPRSGSWTAIASMSTPRSEHTATLLLDGTVLVAGGDVGNGATPASAEVYDPANGSWTAVGPMIQGRYGHTAARLSDGRVLVTGGYGAGSSFEGMVSAELYDPATASWTAAENMHEGRYAATATLLLDGTVLIAGGNAGDLYDPTSGSWTATGNMIQGRSYHTATLLADGTVLVAGGAFGDALASAELYDPATGSWTAAVAMLQARYGHTAALLADGTVLVAGGSDTVVDPPGSTSAELYDPGSGT
jgi:N-acetylneuraminic acid mutarotase